MNNTLIIKLTAFLTALLCMASCTVGGDDDNEYGKGMLEEGTIAPDFMIYTDSRPEGFALSSLRGQYVLIEFWASWCPDCQKETENMKQMYATYAPQYNPQNEMFRHFRTKCSISQNETYLRESFSLPINQIKKHRKNLLLRCFFIACLFGYLAKIH